MDDRATVLHARGLRLEYVTLGWNVAGVAVLAAAAITARSVALAGFGLDSAIEILASLVVVWELDGQQCRRPHAPRPADHRRGVLRAGGVCRRAGRARARSSRGTHTPSALGIAWTAVTCAVMLALAAGKAATGRALGNPVLRTEARVTLIDAYLAASVLFGLVLNAAAGWWWADPVAGLVIVFYGVKEGRAAFGAATEAVV